MLRSEFAAIVNRATELVTAYPRWSLDALQLAVADLDGRRVAGREQLRFVTTDREQAIAAGAIGLEPLLLGS